MAPDRKRSIYLLVSVVILLAGLLLILLPIYPSIMQAIGTSLVASGIIALLDLWYSSIVEDGQEKVNNILASGFSFVYNHRDIDKYHHLMNNLSSRLDISGYSLRNFYESFHNVIENRIQKRGNLKVRILVVDPDSFYSQRREELEGHTKGTFLNQIDRMKKNFEKYGNNVEIRKLDGELSTMIFRIDDTMFVGPYFSSRPSKSTVTFEVTDSKNTWLFDEYEREFNSQWDQAKEV